MADYKNLTFTDHLRSVGIFGNKNTRAVDAKVRFISTKQHDELASGIRALQPAQELLSKGVEASKIMGDKDVPAFTRQTLKQVASHGATKEEVVGMQLPDVQDATKMGGYNRTAFENYGVKPYPAGFKDAEAAQADIEKRKSTAIAQKRTELGFKDKKPITQSGIKGWNGKSMVKENIFFSDLKDTLQEFDAQAAEFYIKKGKTSNRAPRDPKFELVHGKFEDTPEGQAEKKQLAKEEPAKGLIAQERDQLISRNTINKDKNRANESTLIQLHCLNILNEFAIETADLVESFDKNILKNLKALTLTEELPTSDAPDIEEQTEPINESLFENMLTSMVPTFSQPMGHPELGLVKPFGGELDDTRDLGPATTPAKRKKRKNRQIAIAMGI